MGQMTIRARLWLLAGGILVVMGAMVGFTYFKATEVLNDQVNRAGMSTARETADAIDLYFGKLEAVTSNVARAAGHLAEHRGVATDDDFEKAMKDFFAHNKDQGIQDVFMALESTGKFSDGTGWQEPADYDARTRSWYKEAVAAGKPIVTEPYVDAITKKVVLSVGAPIRDSSGKILGVAGIDVNMEALSAMVTGQQLFDQGFGMLIDAKGLILAAPDASWVLKENMGSPSGEIPESLAALGKTMLQSKVGFGDFSGQSGEQRMFFAQSQHGFFFGVVFPRSEIASIVGSLTNRLLMIALPALLVILVLILPIIRSLDKSIHKLLAVTEQVGQGDLSVSYDVSGKNEISQISRGLNKMIESLRDVLSSIREESDKSLSRAEALAALSEETVAAMEEVRSSMEQMGSLLESNSSALEEANASIEEVASGASASATSATDGAEASNNAMNIAQGATEQVSSVIDSIEHVGGRIKESMTKMSQLEESVKAITGFVTTITNIADQTNLLALNAAIEAARAGEAGRGFAVVAEEVRKLAEESASAAKQVGQLIATLKVHAESSLSVSVESAKIMGQTIGKAGDAQKALQSSLGEISHINEAMQNIAAVSQQQAASSEEMAEAINHVTESITKMVETMTVVKSATADTSTASENVASEAQAISEGAKTLSGHLERFRTGSGGELREIAPPRALPAPRKTAPVRKASTRR